MRATIKNISDEIYITVQPKIPLLHVNDKDYEFNDMKEADLFYHIIDYTPNVLAYKDIISLVLDKYNVANTPYSDKVQYIRKKKLSLQKFLTRATGVNNIIVNTRSIGYKLSPKWEKVEDKKPLSTAKETPLLSLEILIKEVINAMFSCGFKKTQVGNDISLSLDTNEIKDKLLYFEKTYQAIAAQVLSELHLVNHEFQHLRVLEILKTIYSYIILARQGANISEDMWRKLFVVELESHISDLKEIIGSSKN